MSRIIVTHVKPGETLSGIAARYGVSVDALQKWNRIENPDLVLVGQRIVVYGARRFETGSSSSGSAKSTSVILEPPIADGSQDILVGGAIVFGLVLLLLLLRRQRRDATRFLTLLYLASYNHVSQRGRLSPMGRTQDIHFETLGPSSGVGPLSKPQINDGERSVSSELRRRYRDWMLIDNVMLPSGQGTTQIDHILVSPSAVFLIETKDTNGWIFGSPGDRQWTQSYAAGRRFRKAGVKSKRFKFTTRYGRTRGTRKRLLDSA